LKPPNNADAELQSNAVKTAARDLGQQVEIINAGTDVDLENAFDHLTRTNTNGFLVLADPFFVYRRQRIITEAAQRRIPGVYFLREFAVSGGLASYGTSLADAYSQVGVYAGKILSGAKPADLPVVQATEFQLVINLKTAKALGLAVPATLLATANEVIE
jgi:putative ABC transport system substrate-binding protein